MVQETPTSTNKNGDSDLIKKIDDAAAMQIDDGFVHDNVNGIGEAHIMGAAQVGKADLNCKTNIAHCVQKGFPIQKAGPMPASCAFDS